MTTMGVGVESFRVQTKICGWLSFMAIAVVVVVVVRGQAPLLHPFVVISHATTIPVAQTNSKYIISRFDLHQIV